MKKVDYILCKIKTTKGQLISKCLMVSSLSPKKRTNEFALSTQTAFRGAKRRLSKKANSFVCFLGESAGHFLYKLTFSNYIFENLTVKYNDLYAS